MDHGPLRMEDQVKTRDDVILKVYSQKPLNLFSEQ